MCVCSGFSDSVAPWTVAHQAPLSMRFPMKILEWFDIFSSGGLPNPGIKPASLASPSMAGEFSTTVLPGAEYNMGNARLDEPQARIKISQRNISNLRYTDDTTFMAESKEEIKCLLMKVKEKSEKVGLKLNIQETEIMVSSLIISWQIDGETMETVTVFIFLGLKITADGDCSHEINRILLLGRKAMTNLDSILKTRDIILPPKACLIKAMVFPMVMYGYESWNIKKAKH